MTRLHLIRLPIALPAFHRWAAERGLGWASRRPNASRRVATTGFDEGRALHHLLAETFGKSVLQPFRLMVAPGQATGNLYAYSRSDARDLTETAQEAALPETLAVCDLKQLAAKSMPDEWREGRRLAFDLRVRPVSRLFKPAGGFGKGAELDAFLVEALRRFPDGPADDKAMLASGRTREAVYAEWLAQRLGPAARLDEARLVRFSRHHAARGSTVTEGPDATIHGALTILDPSAFAERLARGVGRHGAYGYGMLLLRPTGRS